MVDENVQKMTSQSIFNLLLKSTTMLIITANFQIIKGIL